MFMAVINILSPHVADMIAAGEVVERPASVIKELVENAFDAGAKNITVEIRDGGATCIRVIDDGCGMAPEDAGIAFLRHATSKLHDERGLEAIRTMGFRGEALAAIAAVSHIELTTRRPEDSEGTYMALAAGEIQEMEPVGCPAGTSITVRDLFFNTPARLKFLKSDRSEASACIQAALRCALGRPEVSVRFLRDGREEFFSPGDGLPESCVYALLGRDLASSLLPCRSEDEGLRLTGFVSSPAAARGNRSAQYFFVNGRFIRSALLQSALEQAYKNTLLSGRFPACVIYLDIQPGAVDVNVHPAKTEVKFSAERQVFNLLYQAVQYTLQGEDRVAASPAAADSAPVPTPENRPVPSSGFFQAKTPAELRREFEHPVSSYTYGPAASSPIAARSNDVPYQTGEQLRIELSSMPAAYPEPVASVSEKEDAVENSVQNVDNISIPDHKILGETMKTYLLVEVGDQLMMIDKHAAHERMNFDRLKEQPHRITAQELLASVTLRVSPEDLSLLQANASLLEELGFSIELFGENAVVIRAVPSDMLPSDAAAAVEEICENLRRGKVPDPQAARDEILHTVACKAAIKAGWDTSPEERERIVREVLSGRVKYCPHGRPVSAVLTRKDLDKMFKRIV
ncbi:MAG: DNA mismatch repair endonuclease MutL [Oscillospiraceae bacterium]|nr:DNA mismatch repair endonuclease MutL [Oscillospiraceae bacterium]